METKRCTKCGAEKGFEEFHKSGRGAFGLKSYCKSCGKKLFGSTEYYRKKRSEMYSRRDFLEKNFGKHVADWMRKRALRGVIKYQAKLRKENPSQLREQWRIQSAKRNKTIARKKYANAWASRNREKVGNSYVRMILAKDTELSHNDFPEDLVELKRLHIQLKREIRNQTK